MTCVLGTEGDDPDALCTYCKNRDTVDSRPQPDLPHPKRERYCFCCGARWVYVPTSALRETLNTILTRKVVEAYTLPPKTLAEESK